MPKEMKVAIFGCGGVGQCIAQDLAKSKLVSHLLLADVNLKGPEAVKRRTKSDKVEIARADGSDPDEVAKVADKVDILVNGTVPALNLKIMEGCLKGGANYVDMATGDKEFGHPMFEDQETFDKKYKDAGLFALCSMGIDPGASDLFAKRAADRMESVDYVRVRDADNSKLEGYEFATYFSPDAMIEECIRDPLYYENGKWKRAPALSTSEVYSFPEPIGPMKVYMTDHEESELVPKFIGKRVKRCDFMITLDETFIEYVQFLKKLGLLSFKPIKIRNMEVAPIEVVVATMPRPDDLAGKLKGNCCVLTEVAGRMSGEDTVIRTWTYMSHEQAYELSGIHATAYQTAMPVAVAVEMFARGEIDIKGVKPPEAVDPVKFCSYLPDKNIPVFEEIIKRTEG
ncbi:MAG: saccharopine dehydrogenase NADP-binding domain-containing protein [Euryarchaeota archaeon]|jgi:saccharopine dehydrogenase (NAD+, L-lysine-forming)|nr:saccharopine dehydrogenase NADP-binding domain-containing protein [Euryarchaeota archaeon]